MEPKKRRVTKADWDRVEKYVSEELENRRKSKFRTDAERIWKEVDRQIAMTPLQKTAANGQPITTWHHGIELGELAKASEVLTSDVMRIMFPADRAWFQPHVELNWPLDPQTGKKRIQSDKQKVADGLLRNLMSQQHKDFGFKTRFRLSVKEALHHGSFVAEIRWQKEMMVRDGDSVRLLGAPVWQPYSMWNAYPDPSPSIIGSGMFYTGSMMLVEYVPKAKLKAMAQGDGWMPERIKLIPDDEHDVKGTQTKDVELVKYYGDITIERSDGDIYLPNAKVILANGKIVYYAPNELPYPSVIFSGYERQDVRDPYYTSPIIKLSPTQKMTTITANKFLDALALKVEPPIEYDGNDPDYVMNDGPEIMPGAKTPTKSMGQGMKVLDIGDPRFALQGLELGIRQLQEGLGVSSLRAGVQESDRQTATEATLQSQGAEVRTMEFIAQLSDALLPYLYMSHELNRANMEEYTFYSDELRTEDVIRAQKKDIQANAMFEVVGAKGVLGELQRAQRTTAVTAFAASSELFAPLLKPETILLDMYRDAGKKNPEDWVELGKGESAQMQQMQAQMQAQVQQVQEQMAKKEQELESVRKKLEKDMQNAELKKLEVSYQEQLLQLKKQLDTMNANDAAQKKEVADMALNQARETLAQSNIALPAVQALSEQMQAAMAQQAQAMAGMMQMLAQSQMLQKQTLDAVQKPKKVTVQRNEKGQIVGAQTIQ